MQGVLQKRHVLAHPWLVIRQFGFGMFVELLRAPKDATFLEVLARYEFKRERHRERKMVNAIDAEALLLQADALSLQQFSPGAVSFLNRVVELEERLTKVAVKHQATQKDSDPLLGRFKAMLQALAAASGPVRAALGTLSSTELMAVEMRVLNQTRKRYADVADQELERARMRLEVVRSHLIRLFRQLTDGERSQISRQLTSAAKQTVI